MDRLKTFFTYALLIVGFLVLSLILENGLLEDMYSAIAGNANGTYANTNSGFLVQVDESKASNVNGYLRFKIKNTTGHFIEKCYAKIDLYSKQNLLAATKYAEINDFQVDEERKFELKFKANEISRYEISMVEEAPDKSNILNLFGWEIDLTNVFGMDLTSMFGENIKNILNAQTIKETGISIFNWVKVILASVPTWAYVVAGGIVLWNMPKGFLFGIFPF